MAILALAGIIVPIFVSGFIISITLKNLECTVAATDGTLRLNLGDLRTTEEELKEWSKWSRSDLTMLINNRRVQIIQWWQYAIPYRPNYPDLEDFLFPQNVFWENYIRIPIFPFALIYSFLFFSLRWKHNQSLVVTPLAGARVAPQL